jgi:methionyl aminopeptidase
LDPRGESAAESAMRGKETIEIKTAEQIAGMRAACRVAREVIDAAARAVRPGVTTDEIDRVVHEATVERGAYPSPLGYRGFPKSVCTSVNEIVTHGIPDSRELVEGDIVNVDVTCYYHGFHGDVNETYPVGEIDAESKRLIQAAYDCMFKGIQLVRPTVMYSQIGDAIAKHAHKQGYEPDRNYVGHGIGALFHTTPQVPHYARNRAPGMMQPGHTFTIEPMINAGTHADVLWPDDWTVATADGKRSAQFEHTLLVTPTGYEILTARTKDSFPYWFL